MANNELIEEEKLIMNGLKYIGFLKEDEGIEINMNLLLAIRRFLLEKNYTWYAGLFPKAYAFDIGTTRKIKTKNNTGDAYYSNDGILYDFNNEGKITLFESGKKIKERKTISECLDIEEKDPLIRHFRKVNNKSYFIYYYINEIDHFFTYCINNYLLGKAFDAKENGVLAIRDKITFLYHEIVDVD